MLLIICITFGKNTAKYDRNKYQLGASEKIYEKPL
jgi:hypothetical protein